MKHSPVYSKQCPTCEIVFEAHNSGRRYCSKPCQPSAPKKEYVADMRGLAVAKTTVGAIGEMMVCADLMRKGYAVFRAVSSACYCDIVAQKSEITWYVEVRVGYRRNDRCYCVKNYQVGVNCMGFWDKETGEVFYFTPDNWIPITL